MKKIIQLTAICLLLFTSCYDDSDLKVSVNNLDARVKALEELCATLNSNISSLQTVVAGLQERDYVTNIVPVKENGSEIGFTLTFAKRGTVTILHGKAGTDGKTPQIGVKVGSDDRYYWTVDGNFMKNTDGSNVSVLPKDGAAGTDGVAPLLKIENGFWLLSTDNGTTWRSLGKADGEPGANGDTFFKDIMQTDDAIIITLADGTVMSIPKRQALAIEFNESDEIAVTAGGAVTVSYTVKGVQNTDKLLVQARAQHGWSVKVIPDATNKLTGKLTVTAPDPFPGKDEILVWVYDGEQRTIMSSLNFITGVIVPAEAAYMATSTAQTLDVQVETNLNYSVYIPNEAIPWLSLASTRSSRTETLTFTLAPNTGMRRTAIIRLVSDNGRLIKNIAITQEAAAEFENRMTMTTSMVPGSFISLAINAESGVQDDVWIDLNNNGIRDDGETVLNFGFHSLYQIASQNITIHGKVTELYCNDNNLISLQVSSNPSLTHLYCYNNQLSSLDVMSNTALKQLNCGYNWIEKLDIRNNHALTELYCGSNWLREIDVSNNMELTNLVCSYNSITKLDVSKNKELRELYCISNGLTALDVSANTKLVNLTCYYNRLQTLDVSKNLELEWLDCSNNQLSALDVSSNKKMYGFHAHNNLLESLIINNPQLNELTCFRNRLSSSAVKNLIDALPMRPAGWRGHATVLDYSNDSNAIPSQADIDAANRKNWILQKNGGEIIRL